MNYHCDLAVSITIGEFVCLRLATTTHNFTAATVQAYRSTGFADREKVNYNRSTAFSVKLSLPHARVQ